MGWAVLYEEALLYVGIYRDETWATYERNDNPPKNVKKQINNTAAFALLFFFCSHQKENFEFTEGSSSSQTNFSRIKVTKP